MRPATGRVALPIARGGRDERSRLVDVPFPWAGVRAMGLMLLVVLGLTGVVRAQAPAAVQTFRFSVFAAKPISDVAFTPRPNAAAQKAQFYPTARSPRYEYRGTLPLKFVDVATGAVIAEATVPPTIHDALLLFTPIEKAALGATGLRYQIAVLDDGAGRHAAGGLAVINLSGLALSGTINAEKIALKAGLNPTLAIGRSAKVNFSTSFKNRTYQSYAATVALGRNERALLILFPPFYPGAFEVQSRLLLDQPPVPPSVVR